MISEKTSPTNNRRRVHLVLSAGGVKCISYAGAIDALEQNGFEFAGISGSSAGSFIGAILASNVGSEPFIHAATNLDLASLGDEQSWLGKLGAMRKPFAMYRKTLVAERFRDIVGGNPKFKDLRIPFATFGVDLRTHKIHLYSPQATPDMLVSDALRVSTAAPFLFPAQQVGENILLDGALVSQSPVWLATAYDDELPIIVLRPKKNVARPAPTGLIEYITSIIDLGGGSRDFYLMAQMPSVRLIDIDCGDIEFNQFQLSPDERTSLVRSGRAAVEAEMKDLLRTPTAAPVSSGAGAPASRADRAAKHAMDSLVNALPAKRDQVFISYSRDDAQWLHRLQDMLQPYTWNRSLNLWADTKIPAGADWNIEIKKALAAAKVAVLLVTPQYLASKFVRDVELPEFVRASQEEGLILIWILVSPCGYKETALVTYQAANNPEFPLEKMSKPDQDAELVKICEQISEALSRPPFEHGFNRNSLTLPAV